ncbi:MAG TPA: SPOR domain-containing protein [Draconibacterium sp.]|nr:SPOR domain-containing protein [Draconibacterium sp.]
MNYIKAAFAQITILFIFLFASNFVFGVNQENPLTQAIQYFDEGRFEEAELILKKLLDEKPDHLMVNYYYGACRTENGHYGTNEILYLLNGSLGESPLKTDYYLAVQYHAKNRWDDALNYYSLYQQKADEEMQKAVQLDEKIQMCQQKINPFAEEQQTTATDMMPTAVPRETEPEIFNPIIGNPAVDTIPTTKSDLYVLNDSVHNDTMAIETTAKDVQTPVKQETLKAPERKPINFVISSQIIYPDTAFFKTKEGLKFYNEGGLKQKILQQTVKTTDEYRKKYGSATSYSEKQSLGEFIMDGETKIYQLREEVSEAFSKAQQAELTYWQSASEAEREEFQNELDDYFEAIHQQSAPAAPDSIILISTSVLPAEGVFSGENNNPSTDELTYKIQLGAYSRGLPAYVKRLFDKLSYIRKIENYTDDKGIVVYTTGNLTNYEDALKMQEQVRQEGVEDAFVVPYFNGKRITLEEAKEIENKR